MTAQSDDNQSTALAFAFRGQEHTLGVGQLFSSAVGETYRDAPEAELVALIEQIESGRPWRDAVASQYAETNPWLHRIIADPSRDLFFRQHPPESGSRILDIGAGWGQITLPLARTGLVCAVEPTPERMHFIQAAAKQESLADRIWFLQADFLDLGFAQPFDLVTCIGVLEWVGKFAPHLPPLEAQTRFLGKIRGALAPGGLLVIGIENRIGLKYLMGASDDHIGYAAVAVLDFELADRKWRTISGEALRAITHTRAELEVMLGNAGFRNTKFKVAFPDYKLPEKILDLGPETEAFLKSNFIPEHDGSNGTPLPFQEELRSHYRTLANLNIASCFAPSFYVSTYAGE